MSKGTAILKAENLTAGYVKDLDIISNCSLELHKGELVGVIGPNGAGKSTLLKVLFGLLPARSGRVLLSGKDITNQKTHKLVSLGIGYVLQVQNIFSALTVLDNLKAGAYQDVKKFDERAEKVFELFPQLKELLYKRAGQLSGGEAQMLAMSRALMMEPDIMLLDEPSAGLSPTNRKIAFESIKNIVGSGVSAIMVEQNARTCLQLCDRAYVLDSGTNAHTGTGADLLNDPKVVELYLGSLTQAEQQEH